MTQKYKNILGVSAFFHDSSAVLIQNNQILAGAQEERFSRKKGDSKFPWQSIKYCTSLLNKNQSVDAIAYYENPKLKLDRIIRNCVQQYPKGAPIWMQTLKTINNINSEGTKNLLPLVDNDPQKIFFIPHHLSHAASAFYPSGFNEAAVLVVDGVGEWATTTIYKGENNKLYPLKEIRFPHSLGLFYSAFTQYCGFKVNSGEYKLMGLAPYGKPRFIKPIFNHLIDLKSDGSFKLNLKYFNFETDVSTINPQFDKLFGRIRRYPTDPIDTHYRDIAASAQQALQRVMLALSKYAINITGSRNLCLAGGVALNCVSNSQLVKDKHINNLWVQPAAGDAGGALGAALYLDNKFSTAGKTTMSPYIGPSFNNNDIVKTLNNVQANYHHIEKEHVLLENICQNLADGKVVGFFQGRMEFGPRALGNRSILADPRPTDMLRKVNKQIKFRESWRPFAPSILEEEYRTYFDGTVSPYMLLTANIKEQYRKNNSGPGTNDRSHKLTELINIPHSIFPAITHCDYSSRIQTVNEKNGIFFRLLNHFHQMTACPMLLNTSFNVRGEPIVCTPEDALNCFINTNMDVLVLENFYLLKSEQPPRLKSRVGKTKFKND